MTKIEERDEFDENERGHEVDSTRKIINPDAKYTSNEELKNEPRQENPASDYFDPLIYAIDFFANYNSDDEQMNTTLVTAKG